jgi:hypothetical protein
MASIIVIASVLLVYYFRDVQLLAAGSPDRYGYRLGSYTAALLIYTAVLCILTRSLDPDRMPGLLRSPAVWAPCLGLHVALALGCLWLRRQEESDRAWMAALGPAPAFILSVMVIACRVSAHFSSVGMVALVLIIVWSFLVAVSVLYVRRNAFADAGFAIDFAAMTNASLVLVAPVNLLLGNLSAVL